VIPDPANAPRKAPAASTFNLPDGYKDKPYLKGVDSMDKVFAMLDGAQTLIGKRPAGIPAPDAPAEEWAKFYDAAGRPKSATEYQFEGQDKADPKFLPKVQEVFYKHGLNAAQAKGVFSDINLALSEFAKQQGVDIQQQNTDFDALGTKVFGAQRDQILSSMKDLIGKHVPVEMKDALGKLPNESLMILAGVLNNVSKAYIKPDGPPSSSPAGTALTPADISAKGRELMASEPYLNVRHPQHDATVKAVRELYAQLSPKK
jgi:hypothetical protein